MSFDIYVPTREKRLLSWDGPGPEMGVEGWYRFVLKNRDGSVARDTGWFKNLITNVGMTRIVRYDEIGMSWGQYLAIGNGTGTPAFTDTALSGTQLGARKTTEGGSIDGFTATYYWHRRTHRWPTGEGTGTISEVAFFSAATGGEMFSHALLVDSGGSPTSIVKGADQSLDVYYELRNYPNLVDASGTIDVSGVSYDYVLRPFGLFDWFTNPWKVNTVEDISTSGNSHYAYNNQGLIAISTITTTGTALGFGATLGLTYEKYTGPLPDYNTGPYYTNNYIEANIDHWIGEIDWVRSYAGNTAWQFTLEKTVGGGGLVKTDEERLRLHIRLTAGRH